MRQRQAGWPLSAKLRLPRSLKQRRQVTGVAGSPSTFRPLHSALTITGLWLLLLFSIQGLLLWFLFLRLLALFSQKGNRGVAEGETQALKASAGAEE